MERNERKWTARCLLFRVLPSLPSALFLVAAASVLLLAAGYAPDSADLFYNPPCSCDLSPALCDSSCCCDTDCGTSALPTSCLAAASIAASFRCSAPQDALSLSHTRWRDIHPWLCVDGDHNPFLSLIYPAPARTDWSTAPAANAWPWAIPSAAGSLLQVGDVLPGLLGGYLSLPQSSGAACTTLAPLSFLQPRRSRCVVVVDGSTLASLCSTLFNISTYTAILPPGSSVSFSDEDLGSNTTLLDDGVCLNAVLAISLTFRWAGQSTTTASLQLSLGSVSVGSVEQTFSVSYLSAGTTQAPSPRSGAPGYLPGRSMLFANVSVVAAGQVLLSSAAPGLLTSTASGLCADAAVQDILFGDDQSSGCVLELGLADFANCTLLGARLAHLHRQSLQRAAVVAAWGWPDARYASEWLPILGPDSSPAATPTPHVPGCSGLPAALSLTLLWTRQGTYDNAQARVVGARLAAAPATWTLLCGTAACLRQTQRFTVTQSVRFVYVADDVIAGRSPGAAASASSSSSAPTEGFADLFYPLHIPFRSDAQQQYDAGVAVVVLVIVGSALAFLFLPRWRWAARDEVGQQRRMR